ncbi:MAG: GNAT family N-acetyltransferase [Desulfotomaculaceae bacterium]|nr:GNAT family N-acetyltransferase [Desulfotomaculaceae bacterium]
MVDIKKGSNSFYVGDKEEDPLAVISFLNTGTDTIIIDRTFVSDELRGQNIGRRLLQKVVDLAREENRKIISRCSFAEAIFSKTTDYEDVLYK